MSSPSKRRRTSEGNYVNVSDSQDNQIRPTSPTSKPSKRASYLSPTKASLARGHPQILKATSEAKKRRESDAGRRQSLRDLVLGDTRGATLQSATRTINLEEGVIDEEDRNGATGVTRATEMGEEDSIPPARSPLKVRQPSARENAIIDQFETVASPAIVPKLVSRSSTPRAELPDVEVDLPPTPRELGKNPGLERPRGLAGSSSPGGNGRRRTRARGVTTDTSPLKPKVLPPLFHQDEEIDGSMHNPEDVELASGLDDGIIDGDATERTRLNEEDAKILAQKEFELSALHKKFKALRNECSRLEGLSAKLASTIELDNEMMSLENLQLLLDDAEYLAATIPSTFEAHNDFKKDSSAWLRLFSCSNLRSSFHTWTKRSRGRDLLVHQITLAAPAPWSFDVLNVSFEITIDIDERKVDSIKFLGASAKSMVCKKDVLSDWIASRVEGEVTKRDMSVIVTGIGRYFEESVHRARILALLTRTYSGTGSRTITAQATLSQDHDVEFHPVTTETQALDLMPYLTQSHLIIPLYTMSDQKQKKLMFSYQTSLSWIGEVSTELDICGSEISEQAMINARRLFHQLAQGRNVLAAFGSVWSILNKSD